MKFTANLPAIDVLTTIDESFVIISIIRNVKVSYTSAIPNFRCYLYGYIYIGKPKFFGLNHDLLVIVTIRTLSGRLPKSKILGKFV